MSLSEGNLPYIEWINDSLLIGNDNVTTLSRLSITLAIVNILSTIVAISANCFILIAFFIERRIRTSTNYFIVSLAATDLIVGVFTMNFFTVYLFMNQWPFGELACHTWLFVDFTTCLTSQYTVFCITFDRYCSVTIPTQYKRMRDKRKIIIVILSTWVSAVTIFFPIIYLWPIVSQRTNHLTGNTTTNNDDFIIQCYPEFINHPIFTFILTFIYFWLTLLLLCGLYLKIYRIAWKLHKKSQAINQRVVKLLTNHNNEISVCADEEDDNVFAISSGSQLSNNNNNNSNLNHCEKQHSSLVSHASSAALMRKCSFRFWSIHSIGKKVLRARQL